MAAKNSVGLGSEVFIVSPDGEVVRTMVARITKTGYYLLNGMDDRWSHSLSFYETIGAANKRIEDQQTVLRKQLRALGRKHRYLQTQKYRNSVMNAPYRVAELRDLTVFSGRRRIRMLKNVRVPETYLEPGYVVYTIIKPTTRLASEEYGYRPHKYFVLETEVESTCFSPDGQSHYTFSTPFVVQEFFLSRMDAATKLEGSGLEPCVHFVSSRKEKEELEKIEDNVPF